MEATSARLCDTDETTVVGREEDSVEDFVVVREEERSGL